MDTHNSPLLVVVVGGIAIAAGVGIGVDGGVIDVVVAVVVVVGGGVVVVCRIDLLRLSFCSISCNIFFS